MLVNAWYHVINITNLLELKPNALREFKYIFKLETKHDNI